MFPERMIAVWLRIKAVFRRRQLDRDLDDELQFHRAMREQKLAESGVPAEEARYAARREFGNATRTKEINREMWTFPFLETLWQDTGYGLRQLRRNPGFTAVAVLTLALGIGANTAIFTLIDGALFRPLPGIEDPAQLVSLFRMQKNNAFSVMGYPDYADYRARNHSFTGLAAHCAAWMNLGSGTPERIIGDVVTGNYFSVLGVQPSHGRLILPVDDTERGAHPVAVLSYALWERKFGGSPATVGNKIVINGYPFTVIGIAPPRFTGILAAVPVDVWVPMNMLDQAMPGAAGQHFFDERAWGWLRAFGRLKPGVAFDQANAEISGIARQLELAYPNTNTGRTVALARGVGIDPDDRAQLSAFLGLLFAGVGLLLLIACANVAGLLMVRATGRQRELSVRFALGATRARLIRHLVTEALILALTGGGLGLLAAPWLMSTIIHFVQPASVIRDMDVNPDARILAFTLLVSVLAGIMFALLPAFRASSPDLVSSLKEGAPGSGCTRSTLQRLLTVGQVSLSFVLLIAAGLLLRSMHQILSADPGFETRNVLLASVDLTLQGYSRAPDGVAGTSRTQDGEWLAAGRGQLFYRQLLERVQALPGISSVSLSTSVPPDPWPGSVSIFYPGQEPPQGVLRGHEFQLGIRVNIVTVAPNYFRTLGISLLQGRDFTKQDDVNAPKVVIISRKLAGRLWPGESAIGKRISWPSLVGPPRSLLQVIGVAADCKYLSLLGDVPLLMYVPLFQNYSGRATLIMRTALLPGEVVPAVRREIGALDKNLPVFGIATMHEHVVFSVWQQRMAASLVGLFALLALFLASLGLYGVMAHSVSQRTHEIGIRMALGAKRSDVLKLVIGQGLVLTLLGVVIGIGVALGVTRFLSSTLYSIEATDPLTFAVVSLVLTGVATLACYIPARRAAKVDPVVALRHE
jgi:macrolide transport system ATP-binding/permease protein